jgi:hypothetical protein
MMEDRFEDLLKKPVEQARASWEGRTGEDRANKVEEFIRKKTKHYAEILGYSSTEILEKLEERRDYFSCNYYQEANFPELSEVTVFNTKEDFKKSFPSGKYICPACKGISTHALECNSGIPIEKRKTCDWKAYGLFGTMGLGFRFVVKDSFLIEPIVYEIFNPVERELLLRE